MRSASSMSTATTRDTPGSCMVTPISCAAISMVILLWLMNRNWVCADILLHQVAEALGVGVVQRRVHLVEQAERRRVELEQREHERDRGERLLAAGEQVDGGCSSCPGGCAMTCTPASRISSPVMLRRASPPPKSVGNIWPKWRFDLSKVSCSISRVSRSMRRIASSSVSSAGREVGRLRVEEVLALAGDRQLFQRRHVDRAQLRRSPAAGG